MNYKAPTHAELEASPFAKPLPAIQSMADIVLLLARIVAVLRQDGIEAWPGITYLDAREPELHGRYPPGHPDAWVDELGE